MLQTIPKSIIQSIKESIPKMSLRFPGRKGGWVTHSDTTLHFFMLITNWDTELLPCLIPYKFSHHHI